MKKLLAIALALVLALSLFGCGSKSAASGSTDTAAEPVKIKVGASVTPHAEILNFVKDTLLKDYNVDMEVVEYTDYVQPNLAVESGELDANYFQHKPYMDKFNSENNTHLVSVAAIHYEPFGIYPGKTKTLDAIPDGAVIAVPNDATNEARALLLLESQNIIKLKDGVGLNATALDIVENPHNITVKEIEAAQLALSLQDVDFACINVNYALQAGLSVSKDALVVEDKTSEAATTYANIICVKEGNENNEAILSLVKVLESDATRDYINKTYNGEVIPMF